MKILDRLLIKAKTHHGTDRLSLAFINAPGCDGLHSDPELWVADCRIWNGKKYSGERSVISKHNTLDEAIEAVHSLAQEYPNNKDIVILIDDIQE